MNKDEHLLNELKLKSKSKMSHALKDWYKQVIADFVYTERLEETKVRFIYIWPNEFIF